MGRAKTGASTEYSDAAEAELEAEAERAWEDYGTDDDDDRGPTELEVQADIEWAGTFNPRPHRRTRLTGLDLSGLGRALRAARAAKEHAAVTAARARAAKPLATYTAKGWHAQLKAITANAKGYAAADRAGLNASKRTLLGWLRGNEPTAANRRLIGQAYADLRNRPVTEAKEAAQAAAADARAANGRVAQAITRAVRDRYGAEVRFFNITDFEFGG